MSFSLDLPFKRALVIGLGRSGMAAAKLLSHAGVEIVVADQREAAVPSSWTSYFGQPMPDARAYAGVDVIVMSPGIDPRPARALAATICPDALFYGELSLGLMLVARELPALPTVLITGTNGKSTVTALVGEMLAADGKKPFVGGNLGDPLCERLLALACGEAEAFGALVLECSSYQLETMHDFRCDVAMVLNVSCDHLDRYDDFNHYALTKAEIFRGLASGGAGLLDANDTTTPMLAPLAKHALRLIDGKSFPRLDDAPEGLQLAVTQDERYLASELLLVGRHNAKNALFATYAARHLGVAAASCQEVLRSFAGLPHRMRHVAQIDGVDYYNDSKATNVAGVVAALTGFTQPFILILGGMAKDGDDPQALAPFLQKGARGVVVMGRDAMKFLEVAKRLVPVAVAENMQEAVAAASSLALAGDAVILSPACASWDQYRSYADRGEQFSAAVHELARGPADTPVS